MSKPLWEEPLRVQRDAFIETFSPGAPERVLAYLKTYAHMDVHYAPLEREHVRLAGRKEVVQEILGFLQMSDAEAQAKDESRDAEGEYET